MYGYIIVAALGLLAWSSSGSVSGGGTSSASSSGSSERSLTFSDRKTRDYGKLESGENSYEIVNSEGEYVRIDTRTDKYFHGLTWDYIISNYLAESPIIGTISEMAADKNEPRRIHGFNVKIQVQNSKVTVLGFLPMRFANIGMKPGDAFYFRIKEFDPLTRKRKYNLILKIA